MDWVRSLWKVPTWLRGMNFCINCTSSHRFAPTFMQLRNDNRWTQTLWNLPKHEFRVQWGGLGAFVAKKSLRDFVARTFALIAPVHTVLHRVSCSYETITDEPKTLWNLPKQEFRVQWAGLGVLLRKTPMWLRGTNFCINCTSSLYFAPSFMQLRNNPKCTQTQMKHTKTWV